MAMSEPVDYHTLHLVIKWGVGQLASAYFVDEIIWVVAAEIVSDLWFIAEGHNAHTVIVGTGQIHGFSDEHGYEISDQLPVVLSIWLIISNAA